MEKTIDIICIGEVLIDFIGHEVDTPLSETKNYHRFLGGSPTNVAVNAARMGLKSMLIASCGKDGLGDYIVKKLEDNKVNTSKISQLEDVPTSVIFVSKSTTTPEFIAYREADCQIHSHQIDQSILEKGKVYHTTCFALSKNPAQKTILDGAKLAKSAGLIISIDLNYSEKIWPNRKEANSVIAQYMSYNPIIKISDDDCLRLFGEQKSDTEIFSHFHDLGAPTICLTKGKNGVVLSDIKEGIMRHDALLIKEIKDTTGAGDAFWTGFLYAQLHHKNFDETITIAQKLAGIKLQNVGRLPENINLIDELL